MSYHLNGKEAEAKAEITVSPALVVWTEGDGQKYGFDDYTNSFEPWKSIEVGKTDFVKATLSPPDAVNDIAFEPDQPSGLIVNPKLPQGVVTNLSVGGANAIGEGNVHPSYKTVEWVPQTLNVATYAKKSRTVVLILVHEQNDDEQKVEFNAIVEPHTLAVKKGANGFLDSVPQGDDKEVEDGITVGKDGRCETNARKNDSPGTDCGMAVFQECLNYYYSQAVFEFKLERGGPITINYDLNRDGKLEMSGRVFSREMKIISDAGMEAHPGFDYYVFLVGGLSEDGVGGIAQAPGKYVFIDAAFSSQANSVEKVIGHELGHAAFGFDENTEDSENLMNRWRGIMLRKPQWDAIQK